MKAGKQRLNLRKKKNLRTSYMENIGMNVLKKKSGDKNLQLKIIEETSNEKNN